jgi:D-beta-D-heptose 7-phosphate kinase/D-beta-D-heptose 1-phosphate adenosyltransferase
MQKILTVSQAVKESERFKKNRKSIVLAGGCFDILHVGHVRFLEKARAAGDVLFVFLESDGTIKRLKGRNRPINRQEDRAVILSALSAVDYVIILPPDLTDLDYDRIVTSIRPNILAVTEGDSFKKHKERQAKMIQADVVEVTESIRDQSTSRLVQILGKGL